MFFSSSEMNDITTLPHSLIATSITEQDDSPVNGYIDSIDSEKTLECKHPGCGATFSKPSKLTIHIRQHTGERPYKCDYDGCGKSYTSTSHLKRHRQTHEMAKKSFRCPKCFLEVSNRQNLSRHCQRFHAENCTFFCKECGLKFNKELKYKEHEAMHKGIALYQCKICSKQCMTIRTFKKHERSHNNKKEYQCTASKCSEVFDKWSLLVKHKNSSHITEYKCKDCEKVFFNKTQLKSHSFIHVDNRSILSCPYEKCPRFYFFKRNLDHHIRTNHLGKNYHCDICDMRLSSKQKIVEHINKIHLAKKKKKKKKKKKTTTTTLGESEQTKRIDAGISKKSMLSKLVGLDLPRSIENKFLNRNTSVECSQEDPIHNSEKIVDCRVTQVVDQTLTDGCKGVINNGIERICISNTDENKVVNEYFDQMNK